MTPEKLRWGIIGAGVVGQKRAALLAADHRLIAITDRDEARAKAANERLGSRHEPTIESLVARPDIDAILVATTHNALADSAIAALRAGKHVLVEKPAGRNPEDLSRLRDIEKSSGKILRVGFNHRFHPAFQKTAELMQKEDWGPLLYFRARYGHGGRLGYEKEWRADPRLSGGGELMDQGVHLIDLCRWLGGEFNLAWGRAKTFFWPMPVEDNGFLFLESPDGKKNAFLHASCTEWKNIFDFEIFFRTAKIQISGLGRSYGQEELRIYRMKPEMGPPALETIQFPDEDRSWDLELQAFDQECQGVRTSLATSADALRAIEIVHEAYRLSCSA